MAASELGRANHRLQLAPHQRVPSRTRSPDQQNPDACREGKKRSIDVEKSIAPILCTRAIWPSSSLPIGILLCASPPPVPAKRLRARNYSTKTQRPRFHWPPLAADHRWVGKDGVFFPTPPRLERRGCGAAIINTNPPSSISDKILTHYGKERRWLAADQRPTSASCFFFSIEGSEGPVWWVCYLLAPGPLAISSTPRSSGTRAAWVRLDRRK